MERSRGCRFIRTPAYFVNLRARHSTSDMLLLHSGKRLQQARSNDEPIITGWKRPGRFAACIILIVSNNTTTNEFSVRLNEISRHVDCYVADLRTNGRGVLPWIPQKYRITSWALISSGYGYNVPHVHRMGWITGVLYIAGPNEIGPDGYPVGVGTKCPSATALRSPKRT